MTKTGFVPRWMRKVNRSVTNPIASRLAGTVPPWALVVHTGRRSGATYRTPVSVSVKGEQVTIALPYGDDTDWVKNLLAADGGELVLRRRRYRMTDPRVVDGADVGPAASTLMRLAAPVAGKALVAHLAREDG